MFAKTLRHGHRRHANMRGATTASPIAGVPFPRQSFKALGLQHTEAIVAEDHAVWRGGVLYPYELRTAVRCSKSKARLAPGGHSWSWCGDGYDGI